MLASTKPSAKRTNAGKESRMPRPQQCPCGFIVERPACRPQAIVLSCMAVAAGLITALPAQAFPPYRTTDADTADPHSLEFRIGVQAAHNSDGTELLAPRLRAKFGLPSKIELVSEFDFLPHSTEFDDAAAGVKWIPFFSSALSIGTEGLVLLPVRPMDHGAGTETQIVATFKSEKALLHVNAGGVYDPRGPFTESGWRASGLVEIPINKYKVGFEVFAKDTNLHLADVRVGAGIIYDMGAFDVRFGAHAGLTPGAPDMAINLWISRIFSFP